MQLIKLTIYSLVLLAMTSLASCKPENPDPGNTNVNGLTGDLTLEFEHFFGKDLFELGQTYYNNQNEEFNFSKFTYYVTNIELKKADGTTWKEPKSYHLNNVGNFPLVSLLIKDVPKGEYNGISYILGIDSITNTSGITEGTLSHDNNMFWNTADGYIFMKLEGSSPQASDGNFLFHIGGYSGKYAAIEKLNQGFQSYTLMIKPNAVPKIHLRVDVKNIFDDEENPIDITSFPKVDRPDSNAQAIAKNFRRCFTFEHIHN